MSASRPSIGPRNRSGRPRATSGRRGTGFDLLCDSDGTVVFGWACPAVFYTRFEGGLTSLTGHAYATRLGALVAQTDGVSFFCDSSRLKQYDLLARSAFVRVVLAHRCKFTSITMLTWAEGISLATKALVETLGDPIDVLTDIALFEARLLKAAPQSRRKL
ncbi:MAG TPA: hypothetical protein VIV60_15455 [Polyangiaceae bacterium]